MLGGSTMEDVLEEILGREIVDEVNELASMREVAFVDWRRHFLPRRPECRENPLVVLWFQLATAGAIGRDQLVEQQL